MAWAHHTLWTMAHTNGRAVRRRLSLFPQILQVIVMQSCVKRSYAGLISSALKDVDVVRLTTDS